MLKGKIIELDVGVSYAIIEEIEYQNRLFILAAICDIKKGTIDEENLIIKEIKYIDGNITTKNIEDDEFAKIIMKKLLDKHNELL